MAEPSSKERLSAFVVRLALTWIKKKPLRPCISLLAQFHVDSLNDQFSRIDCRKNHEKNQRRNSAVLAGSHADAGARDDFTHVHQTARRPAAG